MRLIRYIVAIETLGVQKRQQLETKMQMCKVFTHLLGWVNERQVFMCFPLTFTDNKK